MATKQPTTAWTKAWPTADGYYWWRMDTRPEYPEVLTILHGEVDAGDRSFSIAEFGNGEWLGPITPADCEQLAALQAEHDELRDFHERASWFLEAHGYRRCDIPACNCLYWHQGHAEQRLTEISDAVPHNGKTILQAVEEMVAENAALQAEVASLRGAVEAVLLANPDHAEKCAASGFPDDLRDSDSARLVCDCWRSQAQQATGKEGK